MRAVSSWVWTDEWQGEATTGWFRATRAIVHVGVAGYPQSGACNVWAEIRSANGHLTRVECPLPDPREQWEIWEIRRPPGAVTVRIRAEDRSGAYANWVAIYHPFRAWPGVVKAGFLFLQLATTSALALTLFWGPGLYWFRG